MTNFITIAKDRELNVASIHEFYIEDKTLWIVTTGGEAFDYTGKDAEVLFTELMAVKAQAQTFAFAQAEFMKYMEKLAEAATAAMQQQGAKP